VKSEDSDEISLKVTRRAAVLKRDFCLEEIPVPSLGRPFGTLARMLR
jgi:hypothetical protein